MSAQRPAKAAARWRTRLQGRPARARHRRRRLRRAARRARRRDRALQRPRPVISGVLTRSRGDFEEILERLRPARRGDRRHRTGARVPAARRCAPASTSSPPTSSCSPSTARSCSRRRASAACGCASRRPWRAPCRSCACSRSRSPATPIERIHGIVNGTTNFILTEMTHGSSYAEALAEAQRQRLRRGRPQRRRHAAATPPRRWRSSRGWRSATPVHLDDVRYEGIEHLHGDDLQYARELGLGLKLIGTAERRDGGLSVRVHPTFLYSGHPLAVGHRPLQRGHRRVRDDHRDHDVGPGRRRAARPRARCSATSSA